MNNNNNGGNFSKVNYFQGKQVQPQVNFDRNSRGNNRFPNKNLNNKNTGFGNQNNNNYNKPNNNMGNNNNYNNNNNISNMRYNSNNTNDNNNGTKPNFNKPKINNNFNNNHNKNFNGNFIKSNSSNAMGHSAFMNNNKNNNLPFTNDTQNNNVNGSRNQFKNQNQNNNQHNKSKFSNNYKHNQNNNNNIGVSIEATSSSNASQPTSVPNRPKNNNTRNSIIPVDTNSSNNIPFQTSSVQKAKVIDTNSFETKYFGKMLENPELLGFQKVKHRTPKVPKYLLQKNVLFDMSTYTPNQWDIQNQQMLLKRESEFNGDAQSLFEEFQGYRSKERKEMEKLNLVDKENAKKSLDDAIIFKGSCQDMCPTFERVERVFKNQVSKWEKDPNTNKISRNLALKTFMRPSGQAPSLPSDVRSPDVLQKTLDYIIKNILQHLPESQSFIWDRTRSIRQDFTFQNNYSGIESIDCHEKICRIHILSLHIMSGADDPDYQQQQEVEQFNNSLQTLTHMYNDVRSRGGKCINEPEFRAYELISKIKDSELDRYIQTLPEYIINDNLVQRAIMLRNLASDRSGIADYYEFFKSVLDISKTSFLLASLAEIHFNEIRYNALRVLGRAYHAKSKKLPTTMELIDCLEYNDEEQLQLTCKLYQLPIFFDSEFNVSRVEITALKSGFKPSQKQAYTRKIDNMISGRTMPDIINKPNPPFQLKSPLSLEEVARRSFVEAKRNTENVQEILESNFTKICHLSNSSRVHDVPSNNFASFIQPINNQVIGDKVEITENPTSFQVNSKLDVNFGNLNKPTVNPSMGTTSDQKFKSLSSFDTTAKFSNSKTNENVVAQLKQPDIQPAFKFTEKKIDQVPPQVESSKKEVVVEAKPVKRLVDNPAFKTEAMKIVEDMAMKGAIKLSNEIIKKQLEAAKRLRQARTKQDLVDKLSKELYQAFMKEQVYLVSLDARAKVFNTKMQYKKYFDVIQEKLHVLSEKKKIDEEKQKEIERFNDFVVPSVPIIRPNSSNLNIVKVEKPIKQKNSIDQICNTFEKISPTSDLNSLIIARSTENISTSWLLDRFNVSAESSYTESSSSTGYKLSFKVLPDDFDVKKSFQDTKSVILQVGTIEGIDKSSRTALLRCLAKDALVIQKIYEYLKLYSKYNNFSILVVYVDSFNIHMANGEVSKILKLQEIASQKVSVGLFKLNAAKLIGDCGVSTLNKLDNNLNNFVEKVWTKMYSREKSDVTISSSINYAGDTGISKSSASTSMSESSGFDILSQKNLSNAQNSLIKRKISYLSKVIDVSKMKRRKFSNSGLLPTVFAKRGRESNSTSNSGRTINNENISKNSIQSISNNNSLMLLRNYETINNSLRYDSNISMDDNKLAENIQNRKRIAELTELDDLIENVLKD